MTKDWYLDVSAVADDYHSKYVYFCISPLFFICSFWLIFWKQDIKTLQLSSLPDHTGDFQGFQFPSSWSIQAFEEEEEEKKK